MNYISAGYFLVMPTPRKDYMDEKIVPETVLSVSDCLCNQYPDTSISWGNSEVKRERYMDQLGLSLNDFQLFEHWIEEHRNTGDVLFPQVFSDLHTAEEFLKRFLIHLPGIRIISIGLPEQYIVDFLKDV